MQGYIYENMYFGGSLSCRQFTPPEGCITNLAIVANAGVDFTKLQQKHCVRHSQKTGTAVVSETVPIHIADAVGSVLNLRVACVTPPTSSDTVTIDLQKGNASTSFATVLTSVVTLNSSSVTRTVYSATILTDDYSANDIFQLVITVSGSSCQGLVVDVNFAEDPQ